MKGIFREKFSATVTEEMCKDAGMAFALICSIVFLIIHKELFVYMAMLFLVISMTKPTILKFMSVMWYGISHMLGSIVSKVLLAVIFFLVVTPIGIIRRMAGNDILKLKEFKKSTCSVMVAKDKKYVPQDMEMPF